MSKLAQLEDNTKLMFHGSPSLKLAGSMHHRLKYNDLGFYLESLGVGGESLRAWCTGDASLPHLLLASRTHCPLILKATSDPSDLREFPTALMNGPR